MVVHELAALSSSSWLPGNSCGWWQIRMNVSRMLIPSFQLLLLNPKTNNWIDVL
jgi:hypothetical protein